MPLSIYGGRVICFSTVSLENNSYYCHCAERAAAAAEVFDTKLGDYKLNFSEPLGHGTFGEVYRAKHIDGGDVVALKRIRWYVKTSDLPTDPKREVDTYKAVSEHRNILKLLDSELLDR